jgi:hypothetical protein
MMRKSGKHRGNCDNGKPTLCQLFVLIVLGRPPQTQRLYHEASYDHREFPQQFDVVQSRQSGGPPLGNSSGGNVTKPATLETGLEIRVPLFIKEGEKVKVSTETREFVARA